MPDLKYRFGTLILSRLTVHVKSILAVVLYGVVAFARLSPLMPNDLMGDSPDFPNLVAAIIQAKMAIDQGQFPIRTALWQFNGWQYPDFQYYSNFPYMVAGYIYKYISPSNPYWAFKFLCWLSLVASAFFIYKLAKLLTASEAAAVLGGTVYMCSPYFLVNILARAAWTEVIAQGIIPIILYYSFRCYHSPGIKYIASTSLAWFALATTHIITFVYSGLFIGLLFLIMVIVQKDFNRPVKIFKLAVSFLLGCLLASYFLAPVILRPELNINNSIQNPYKNKCQAPLSSLVSPTANTPAGCSLTKGLSPSIGWPILLSWLAVTYFVLFHRPKMDLKPPNKAMLNGCYTIFCLAAFMTWSPFDFWSLLPRFLWVAQFTYRMLSHTMWSGAILSAYTFVFIFGNQTEFSISPAISKAKNHRAKLLNITYRLTTIHFYIAIIFCAVCVSSIPFLLPQKYINPLSEILKDPDLGYGQAAYLMNTDIVDSNWIVGNVWLPLVYSDGWLIIDQYVPVAATRINSSTFLKMSGVTPEIFSRGLTLFAWQDGTKIAKKYVIPGPFVWEFPVSRDLQNTSKDINIKFTSDRFFVPKLINPKNNDARHLAVSINSAVVDFGSSNNAMPVSETQNYCLIKASGIVCDLTDAKYHIIELPILYYPPPLIDVKIDGQETNVFAIIDHSFLLAGVAGLKAGKHYQIEARFQGLPWANSLSLGSWLFLAGLIVMDGLAFFRQFTGKLKYKM